MKTIPFRSKEISWLSFNARVLQEAADKTVPLQSRIRFLGIYSSNMDEFFRVRVATLRRLTSLGAKKLRSLTNEEHPEKILAKVQKIFLEQHESFDLIYRDILDELTARGIDVIDETRLDDDQRRFVRTYFREEVRPRIFPVMVGNDGNFPELVDRSAYLFVVFDRTKASGKKAFRYSMIELPTETISRFVQLPDKEGRKYIMLLDDVIRCCIDDIFASFGHVTKGVWSIKMIRDAELEIDDDLSESIIHKVNKSLKKRKQGNPVRFSYDAGIPDDALNFILKKLGLKRSDSIIPGGRYNNYRDFFNFPTILSEEAQSRTVPRKHPDLISRQSIMGAIDKKDILLHFPWHSFDNFIDLLREAAIDPDVKGIRMTLYRVARNSSVINALINARRNGKSVTVIFELQARFDEEANIYWADRLREEGAHVIYGVYGLKVHSKLCIIERVNPTKKKPGYLCIGTGNFNETTARLYTDCLLLTSQQDIVREGISLFDFFEHNYKVPKFDHLVVSPFYARKKMIRLVEREIENARAGREAYILLKLNNMADPEMIKELYEASAAGVQIRLIVRGMFSLVTDQPSFSENIQAIGIVDSLLEHVRVFIFCNGGKPLYFISSSDWLPRNFDRRIEVTCPVYDRMLQQELQTLFDTSWQDNVKARVLDADLSNSFRKDGASSVRSQVAFGEYLAGKG